MIGISCVSHMGHSFPWCSHAPPTRRQEAKAFNSTLESWDTSKVKTMAQMFTVREAPIPPHWRSAAATASCPSRAKHCGALPPCQDAKAFNQPLSSWDVSGVASMTNAFWVRALPAIRPGSPPHRIIIRLFPGQNL